MIKLWNRLPEYVAPTTNINTFEKNDDAYYTTSCADVQMEQCVDTRIYALYTRCIIFFSQK